MKNLETLIQELCPDGVEFVKLVKYANVQYGFAFDSKLFTDDEQYIPLIRIRDVVPAKPSTYYSGEYSSDYIIRKGDMLVGMDGNFNMEKWNDRDGLLNQRVCKIYAKDESLLLDGFLYHFLRPLFKKIENSIQGSTVKHLSAKVINHIEIPLPPIEVQTEIVRILDKFTSLEVELEAELEAELDCRKRQYEYYRDKLLSFDNVGGQEVTISKIGDIGRICMCKRIMKNQTNSESGIPFYKIGTFGKVADAYISNDVYEEYKKLYSYPKKGDILMSASGTIGRTVVFNGEPSYFQDSNIVWVDNDETKVLNSYLNYYYQIIEWKTQGGTIKRLYNNLLAGATIKYPSLDEQHRIVSILDRFESLTTSLQTGLPAEISARRQQYEYYRDKLLTFKRKGAA